MICFFKFCSNFQRSYRVCMRRNHQYYYYKLKMSHFLRPYYPPQNRKNVPPSKRTKKKPQTFLGIHLSNATFKENVSAKIQLKFQRLLNLNGRLNGPLLSIGVPYPSKELVSLTKFYVLLKFSPHFGYQRFYSTLFGHVIFHSFVQVIYLQGNFIMA